jgi:hypothetical protein
MMSILVNIKTTKAFGLTYLTGLFTVVSHSLIVYSLPLLLGGREPVPRCSIVGESTIRHPLGIC